MAKLFGTSIDLGGNEVQNFKVHNVAGDPPSPDESMLWYDTVAHVLVYYDGTQVHHLFELEAADVLALLLTVDGAGSGLDADLLDGQHGAHYLDRANHTGTQAQSTITDLVDDLAAKIGTSEKGAANGVAELDANGKVPLAQLPDDVLGALDYQGTWDADSNDPTLASSTGTKGHYYVVATAGTTDLDGEDDWGIGDWVVFNGSEWQKVDNSDKVSSVNGQTGAVVLDAGDIGYDNGNSGLSATDVQAAIDEIVASGGTIGRHAEAIGNGSATQFDVTHSLGTRDVIVQVYQTGSPYAEIEVEVERMTTNVARIRFAEAPASDEYTVVVLG